MMFVSLLTMAVAANAAFDQATIDRIQKDLRKKSERLPSAEIIDMMLPTEFKGTKIIGSVERPQSIVERFLKAILPGDDVEGYVEYKFYADKGEGGKCSNKANYVGQTGVSINQCFRVKSDSGELNSIMLEASNHNDELSTTMKLFTDKGCQDHWGDSDQQLYPRTCDPSPVKDVAYHQAKWMKVKYSKRDKVRAKDIDSLHAHLFGFSDKKKKCNNGKMLHYDAISMDCFPYNSQWWAQGDCQNASPDWDTLHLFNDAGCTILEGSMDLLKVGCAKWSLDDDDYYYDDDGDDDDDEEDDDWAPWSGLGDVTPIEFKYEGGMCFPVNP